ncbi:hypothetical protein ACFL5L_04530 [candidate division KSB1 bacterium]
MIIRELKQLLNEYKSKPKTAPPAEHARDEFGGLSGAEILLILRGSASVQAIEETLTCISNQGFKGASYRDLINTAEELGFQGKDLDVLKNFKPHLPFFISSLGPHLVNILVTYLSTKYFKERNRVSPKDRDVFYSYYRTSTGLGLGLGMFSALNSGIDVIQEVFKTALGFSDATSTVMPQHLSLPDLGMMSETSTLAAQADIAAATAISLGPLLRSEETVFAKDSVVHLNIGDSGVNEPTFPNGYKLIRRHMYQIAKYFIPKEELNDAIRNPEKEHEIYKKLKDEGNALLFASHVYDNKVGISAPRDVSQSFQDPLYDYLWMEKEIGLLSVFRYDSLNFLQTLQETAKLMEAARKGPVMAHVEVVRTGGHSLSNYYGFGMIAENAKASPISSLTLEEARYHNNNDSILNGLKVMIDEGYLTKESAVSLIDDAYKTVIERLIDLIPAAETSIPKKSVIARWPYNPENAQTRWNELTANRKERDGIWKEHHLYRLSKTPGLRFKKGEGIELPEEMDEITPIQAENFSLADILMLTGTFRAFGEDIQDIRPDLIEEVINNPGSGTGGINKATAGLQALSHIKNRKTGRYHILDIGIDESGLYALAAAMSRSVKGRGFVMCEMQFNDYDFGLMAPEEISSVYQRSNGLEILPVIIRQSYGFVRGRTIKGIFEQGGAAGMYHSSCHIGHISNRYKGLAVVVPNTARAIQMAYRNAVSAQTPTVVLMSNPAMRSIAIGKFPYTGKYLPLDAPLDPLGTYYTYSVDGSPLGSHHHIVLTYGEYAPICHYVAEQLAECGIRVLVVDYNYIVPRNENAGKDLMAYYRNSSIKPRFTVVSQEGDFGFGDVILADLLKHGITSDKICKEERSNQWLAEWLTFPTPEHIYNRILDQQRDIISAAKDFVIEDIPLEKQAMAAYYAGF